MSKFPYPLKEMAQGAFVGLVLFLGVVVIILSLT